VSEEGTFPGRHGACCSRGLTADSKVLVARESIGTVALRVHSAGRSFGGSHTVAIYGANIGSGALCGSGATDSRSSADLRDGTTSLTGSTSVSVS